MSVSVRFTTKKLDSLSNALKGLGKTSEEAIKKSTLYTHGVVTKDFLSVSDGVAAAPGTRIRGTKRSNQPGLRTSTGHLKRNLNWDVRLTASGWEGAVGTNIHYGIIHERRGYYNFLKPGLEKAMPKIKEHFAKLIKAHFEGSAKPSL